MDLLERENVHKRPDFEVLLQYAAPSDFIYPIQFSFWSCQPWTPIDVDMPVEKRNAIFEKAKTKVTPMLFIDDEYIGDWKKVEEINESGELFKLLEY